MKNKEASATQQQETQDRLQRAKEKLSAAFTNEVLVNSYLLFFSRALSELNQLRYTPAAKTEVLSRIATEVNYLFLKLLFCPEFRQINYIQLDPFHYIDQLGKIVELAPDSEKAASALSLQRAEQAFKKEQMAPENFQMVQAQGVALIALLTDLKISEIPT